MENIREKHALSKIEKYVKIPLIAAAWIPVLVLGSYQIIQYPQRQEELLAVVDTNKDRIVTNDELARWGDNNGLGYHPFESPMKEVRNTLRPYLEKR